MHKAQYINYHEGTDRFETLEDLSEVLIFEKKGSFNESKTNQTLHPLVPQEDQARLQLKQMDEKTKKRLEKIQGPLLSFSASLEYLLTVVLSSLPPPPKKRFGPLQIWWHRCSGCDQASSRCCWDDFGVPGEEHQHLRFGLGHKEQRSFSRLQPRAPGDNGGRSGPHDGSGQILSRG